MNVAYHCSDGYVPVLAGSICSLLENNKESEIIRIFVIEDSISEEKKSFLSDLVQKYSREVSFIPMPDVNKKYELGLKPVRNIWFFNSYIRLFLYDILPSDVDRVLYLDSDTIINGDLESLYNQDLGDNCFGAAPDCLSKKYYDLFGLSYDRYYVNSGVLLQDLNGIRKIGLANIVRDYVQKSNGFVFFMEQTVLSVALSNYLFAINPSYNVQTIHYLFTYKQYLKYKKPTIVYSREVYDNCKKEAKIYHLTNFFAVVNRAWFKKTNHPLKGLFISYLSLSGLEKDNSLFADKRSFFKRVMDFAIRCIPNSIKAPVFGFIYNHQRIKLIKKQLAKYGKSNR